MSKFPATLPVLRARTYFVASATTIIVAALATMMLLLSSAGAAPADTIADRVYGQGGSFTSGTTCNLGGINASSLCRPSPR